ncbi:hypothetical protein QE152_g9659 [Popillia japonica]|uniref:Uncharacterized protein n=1 Tax=Popillia japonica TaxID=7064 RepID=A0AAW1LU36_POPJA
MNITRSARILLMVKHRAEEEKRPSFSRTNSIEEVLFNDGYDSDMDPEFVATEAEEESSDSSSVQEGSETKENSNDSTEPSRFSSRRPKRGRKRNSMNLIRAQNKKAKNGNKLHYDYKRRIMVEKKLETFQCSCSKKCSTTFSLAQRQQSFKKF